MRILSIDTSADETSAAVTENTKILSNIVWSQASLHADFGGVMPSLAQRMHQERIDWVIKRAMLNAKCQMTNIDAFAVTVGPGLSIALRVGIAKAKELAVKHNKKLIAVNHLEGHILSFLDNEKLEDVSFPALGLVISGGNTILVKVNKIGSYKTLAATVDDALGEALDKAARMFGLGYPGGAILEKLAKEGNSKAYKLPVPLSGQENRKIFSYSGLKSATSRLVEIEKNPSAGSGQGELTKKQIVDLAASFQNVAFQHLIRVVKFIIGHLSFSISDLLVGGGVAANVEIRRRLRKMAKESGIKVHFPNSKKLYGDNAAMIGIAAYFKAKRKEFIDPKLIDENPNAKIDG